MVTAIDTKGLRELLADGKPVVVDFHADWCRPCHALAPEIETLAGDLSEEARFVKIDIDENPELAQELGIMSIPTVIHFSSSGDEVARNIGVARADELKQTLGL